MFRFGPPKYSLGIDIGSSSIKFVQMKKGKTGPEIVAAGIETYPEGVFVDGVLQDNNAISQMIKTMKKEHNLRFEQVYAAISGQDAFVRFLILPDMDPEELRHAVDGEAEQYVPYPLDTVNINYTQISKVEQEGSMKLLCLLAAAQKDHIETTTSIFKSVGVKQLDAMDIDSLAVLNALERFLTAPRGGGEEDESLESDRKAPSSDEVVAVICIGAKSTIINVLKGNVLRFSRNVKQCIAGNNITEIIKTVYKVSAAEAEATKIEKSLQLLQGQEDEDFESVVESVVQEIALDVRRSLDFFKAQHREPVIHRAVITGGTSKFKNIANILGNELSIEVEIGDPSYGLVRNMPAEEQFQENLQHYSVALGLALRGCADPA